MVWVALGIVAVIKFNFDYLLVVGVAIILNAANIVGFTKCRKGNLSRLSLVAVSPLEMDAFVLFTTSLLERSGTAPKIPHCAYFSFGRVIVFMFSCLGSV